jgi:hypothetical protein
MTTGSADAPRGRVRRPGRRWAVLAGVALTLAYLAGAVVSGRQSPLARRPLLDGLAPPPPYHWVKPPPELAAANKPPSGVSSVLRLTGSGSEVSAVSTGDGQASLVLEANAIAASPGQRDVAVTIQPVDPATLGPAPPGMVLAGNAYRIRFAYRPSAKPATLSGRATVVLVFPLLPISVSSLFDYAVLSSADGRTWARQTSSATPGSHQVGAVLPAPGYVVVGVPPASANAGPAPNRIPLIAGLVGLGVLIAMAAVALGRRLRGPAYDEDDDEEADGDEDGGGGDHPDPGPGSKEGR